MRRMRMKRLVLVLTCLWASPPCLAQVRSPMPVLWVMPVATVMPGEQNVTAALAPAVSIALEDLRGRGGPQMHLQLLDSQCDSATALKGIFDAMWEEPGHMIIFGGVCPQVTAVLAQSLHALDMVQPGSLHPSLCVSRTATPSQLSFTALPAGPPAQRRPPGLFSTVPSEAVFNAALVRLLQHYRWTRVGLLTQEGARPSQEGARLFQLPDADPQLTADPPRIRLSSVSKAMTGGCFNNTDIYLHILVMVSLIFDDVTVMVSLIFDDVTVMVSLIFDDVTVMVSLIFDDVTVMVSLIFDDVTVMVSLIFDDVTVMVSLIFDDVLCLCYTKPVSWWQMRQNLVHQLMKADVQMVEAQSVGEDPCLKLQKLKDRGVRVLVAQVDEGPGSRVLCCAYGLNLFGSGYQWLLASGPDPMWTLDPEASGCSLYALHAVLEGSIRLSLRPLGDSGLRGVSGRTPAEYELAYRSEIRQQGAPDAYLHGYAYDGVWVLARAVSLLTEQFRHRKRHSPDRNLSINQAQTADMLLAALKQTQFEGVTGTVRFHNGERVASIELRQFQATREVLVGQYNTFTQELRLFPDHLKFPGSGPAPDGSGVRLECGSVGRVLYAVVTSAAALLFITSLIFLLRSLSDCTRYRGPRGCGRPLDPLLLLGMMLALSWVPLAGLDKALAPAWWWDPLCSVSPPLVTAATLWGPAGDRSDTRHSGVPLVTASTLELRITVSRGLVWFEAVWSGLRRSVLPQVRLWVLTLGHCVAVGVLTTRSLNIYRHLLPRPGAGKREDRRTCWPLAAMFLLDVLFLCCWQALDPLRRVERVSESGAEEEQDGVSADTDCCVSTNMDLWITALYAYKGPLLGLACFLAGSLRSRTDVARAVTREGHRVALSVFAVAASSSLGALGSLLSSQQPQLLFLLPSLAVLGAAAALLVWGVQAQVSPAHAEVSPAPRVAPPTAGAEPRGEVSCSVPPAEGATQRSSPESQEGGVQRLTTENQELRRRRRQLRLLSPTCRVTAGPDPALRPPAPSGGGCVQRSSTVAQISCHSPPGPPGPRGGSGGDGVNTPERLRRRMSVQLPILHHAYHPVVGGVASSHSSQLETPEAPPPHRCTRPAAVSQV
ncbi:gamma-aminobutyric acid type B receptor subunit 2-like [Gadus macrocephalus]|uniref:gamma-aminobutyric acid type B receptor subunit 2-like n=1 Tax=Gadus macrocephalus TaxID=80720 RepID=UPI0028CB6532|nr:gamma-aminobutyric acid type B receptor subunit 2-like [Gadus macrocephalus]